MNKVRRLVLLGLIAHAAHSQVKSGTLIIFNWTPDKFLIAADSRSYDPSRPEVRPDDCNCKIIAYKNHVIFSTSGQVTVDNKWHNVRTASWAVGQSSATASAKNIADTWAGPILWNWSVLNRQDHSFVASLAQKSKGIITIGIFAKAQNGKVDIAAKGIIYRQGVVESIDYTFTTMPASMGHAELFSEFSEPKTARARFEADKWKKAPHSKINTMIHYIELAAKYDTTKEVGGKVDALELRKDGTIHWLRKKPNCPRNSE